MKNKEQILLLIHEIYWDMEHGAVNAACARLDNLQHESRRGGLEQARNIVSEAANNWRGAHINTNDSCGQIRTRIKEAIEKPNPPLE